MKDLKELTTIKELIQEINNSFKDFGNEVFKKKLDEIKEEIKRLEEKPKVKTVYDLKKGDMHYFINAEGMVIGEEWKESRADKRCLKNGNIFLTKAEAQKRVLRNQIESLLNADSLRAWGGNKNDVKAFYIDYFVICRSTSTNSLKIDFTAWSKTCFVGLFGAVNFPTKESLIESIERHKKLLCDFFGVKDFEVV